MKKFFLAVLSFFILVVISGCNNTATFFSTSLTSVETTQLLSPTTPSPTNELTTMSQLSLPSDISIDTNIITFSIIQDVEKYKIYVYDATDQLVGEYNITSGFDLSLLLSLGDYKLQLKTTARGFNDSSLSEDIHFSIVNPNQVKVLEGDQMNNIEYIRWMGRTYYSEEEELEYFYFTASGFEVGFYGTELIANIFASNHDNLDHQAYVVVLLDGEEDPSKGKLIKLDRSLGDYTLVEELEYGYHTVKLLKRSEAIDSDTAIKSIRTDGYFTSPPKAKSFKLQFIAASSSTGYGNLGSASVEKTSANSDGLRAFAYLTSFMLDSEISIFSASGWGVSRGWNTSGQLNETQNIPNAFRYLAIDDNNRVLTEAGLWDSSNYIPDVIVINLGTNDFSSSGYSRMTSLEQDELIERFKEDYISFLLVLNNMYPQAKIIVAYGLMNENHYLEEPTLEIIEEANQEINHQVVYPFLMEGAGTNGNPTGSNSHPNVGTSMNVAIDLADFISLITGKEVVREMIE